MKQYKKYLAVSWMLICLIFLTTEIGFAMSLQVAPNRFVFPIDQRNTQEVMVTNVSNHPIRVKIYPEAVPGQRLEEYLGDWVVVYPRLIRLQPGEKKMVRFSVRAPQNLQDGEYRSLLFFEELPVEESKTESNGEMALDIQLLTKLGINLYGQFGQLDGRGELKNVELFLDEQNQMLIRGEFKNTGNAHLETTVTFVILDSKKKIVNKSSIPLFVSHRSSITHFTHQLPLDGRGGEYTLKIYFKQNDVMIHEYSRMFEIKNSLK